MTGTMTHNILLTRLQGGKTILLTRDGVPKDPYRRRNGPAEEGRMTTTLPLSYDQARCSHPPFAECYAIQAFSIASDFDPQLMPKIQNQITMRKVCIVIQSLVPRRPNHHSFFPSHCRSEGNQACLPGPLCSSSREGATHSVQISGWARTRSCSRSSILAPNSSESGSPPPSSRAARREDQKRNPPLIPDTAPSEAMKGHWTQEGYEGPFGTRGKTVLRPKAYVDLQPLGLSWGEEKSDSPFVSTLSPPSRHGPDMQAFQQASCSSDQAYPDPRCEYVGYRPAYGPSALHLLRAIWRGIVAVPTDVP